MIVPRHYALYIRIFQWKEHEEQTMFLQTKCILYKQSVSMCILKINQNFYYMMKHCSHERNPKGKRQLQ